MRFTLTPTPSNTATPSLTPSNTPSYTPTGTVCPGLTPTMTPSVSLSPTITLTNTATPTGTIVLTPTNTETPTPTPTYCIPCNFYVNNTFETLEIDYQSCEGVWYYNELIPANQGVCIIEGTGGGIDWSSMSFQSYNCGGSPCPTPTPEYDLYEADRFTCLYPGCALDASAVIVALPAGTTPNYGKFYSSLIPDGFSYELIGLGSGGPGWILSTLNYTNCADACAL